MFLWCSQFCVCRLTFEEAAFRLLMSRRCRGRCRFRAAANLVILYVRTNKLSIDFGLLLFSKFLIFATHVSVQRGVFITVNLEKFARSNFAHSSFKIRINGQLNSSELSIVIIYKRTWSILIKWITVIVSYIVINTITRTKEYCRNGRILKICGTSHYVLKNQFIKWL